MTWTFLGFARHMAGRLEKAVEIWERMRAANPDALADLALELLEARGGAPGQTGQLMVEALRMACFQGVNPLLSRGGRDRRGYHWLTLR